MHYVSVLFANLLQFMFSDRKSLECLFVRKVYKLVCMKSRGLYSFSA